jgi:hypothetical protein
MRRVIFEPDVGARLGLSASSKPEEISEGDFE